jgi:hypothetical protein
MTDFTIKQKLRDLLSRIEGLSCKVCLIDDEIVLLDGRVTTLESDVLIIQSDITTIEGDIITINSDISDLQIEIDLVEVDVVDHEARITALEGAPSGTTINLAANYAALPDPTTVSGEFYYAQSSQGSAFWPGSLGGTYYKAGLYYSNGVAWLTDVNPFQAAQADVDAGIITDQFVSPATLASAQTIVLSVAKSGEAEIKGDITLSEGSNITLTQVGNDIEIASTGGSSPSIISPSQITSDQDNYNPTGFSTATLVRLDFDTGGRAITGFAAGTDGQRITLSNISANFGYYPGNHPDSSSGNRFLHGKDFIHYPYSNIDVIYDSTSGGWRIIGEENTEGKTGLFYEWSAQSVSAGDNADAAFLVINSGTISGVSSTTSIPATGTISTASASNNGGAIYLIKTLTTYSAFASAHQYAEGYISIPTLSDGTETFTAELQITNAPSSASLEPNNTIGIRYSHSIAGGNWELFSQDNSGAEGTPDDLDVAVTANALYKLRIEIDKSKTEARAYINGAYVGRVTTNMPNSVVCGARVILLKSAGTTARTLNVHSFSAGAIY